MHLVFTKGAGKDDARIPEGDASGFRMTATPESDSVERLVEDCADADSALH